MIIKVVDTDTKVSGDLLVLIRDGADIVPAMVPVDFTFNYDELDGVTLKDLLHTMVEAKGSGEDAAQLNDLENDEEELYSNLLSIEIKTLVDVLNGELDTFCKKLFERDYEYCKDIYSSIA